MIKFALGCIVTIASLLAIDHTFPNQIGKVSRVITGSVSKSPTYASDIYANAQNTKLYKDIAPTKRFAK
jgi:hypothetical protein